MRLASSGRVEILTRKYGHFMNALAEIGGFFEISLFFAWIFYFVFIGNSFVETLVKSVFGDVEVSKFEKLIDKNFDTVELMKEFSCSRVLNRLFFKERHLSLLPDLLLKMDERENERKDKKKTRNERAPRREDPKKGKKSLDLKNWRKLKIEKSLAELKDVIQNGDDRSMSLDELFQTYLATNKLDKKDAENNGGIEVIELEKEGEDKPKQSQEIVGIFPKRRIGKMKRKPKMKKKVKRKINLSSSII